MKEFSQRYAEEHPDILAINLMKQVKTTRRLKKNYLKTHVPDRIVIYSVRHWAYALGDFHKLSNVLLNITQSGSL